MNKLVGILVAVVVGLAVLFGSTYFKYYNLGVTYE